MPQPGPVNGGADLLVVADLAVRYGRAVQALRGVSLQVGEGAIVAVLGSNGAGKTTLLRTISGTYRLHRGSIEAGSIHFAGREITGAEAGRVVSRGVVQVPEGRRIFGRLTVEENLRAGGLRRRDKGGRGAARDRVYELFPVLAERRRQRGGAALRRRAADARDRPRPDGRAAAAAARRAVARARAARHRPDRRRDRRDQPAGDVGAARRAERRRWRSASPTLPTSSTSGSVSLSGTAAELRRSDEVPRLYLGDATPGGPRGRRARRRPPDRWTGGRPSGDAPAPSRA